MSDPAWKVTRQEHLVINVGNGQVGPGWRIEFTTAAGVPSSIEIPDADYTVDNVTKLIEERAATINAVHALEAPTA